MKKLTEEEEIRVLARLLELREYIKQLYFDLVYKKLEVDNAVSLMKTEVLVAAEDIKMIVHPFTESPDIK